MEEVVPRISDAKRHKMSIHVTTSRAANVIGCGLRSDVSGLPSIRTADAGDAFTFDIVFDIHPIAPKLRAL